MGELKSGSPIRIWAGESSKSGADNLGLIIYHKRLPKGVSLENLRKELLNEIEKIVNNRPYDYWISPKAKDWLDK
ncbi:hypothetical protein ACFLTB_03830 [Chloroflexota bacterium]